MDNLSEIYDQLVANVPSKKRKKGFETFDSCFVASAAVKFLVKQKIVENKAEAITLMRELEKQKLVYHVTSDMEFVDSSDLFRFATIQKTKGMVGAEAWAEDAAGITLNASELKDAAVEEEIEMKVAPLDVYNVELLNNVHPKSWTNPETTHFDLLVIGAGAGGLISTIQGAGLGLKTALIEQNLLGGDCLNVGCVPSKALLRCAKAAKEVKGAADYGVIINGSVDVDFGFVMERMRKLRAEISPVDSYKRYTEAGASVFQGRARFLSRNSVEVYQPGNVNDENVQKLTFGKCIIATGGRAFIPNIPGLKEVEYLTNATLFNLTELPKAFGVIGSGPIGSEMAQAFAMFGSKVFVFDQAPKILPREDEEAAIIVKKSLEEAGVNFFLGSAINKVEKEGNQIKVSFSFEGKEEQLLLDQLLVSAGRTPNVEGLKLEAARVQYHQRGIKVEDGLRTTNKNIYAVGDVCLKYQFTHMADASAKVAFRNAMFPFTNEKMSDRVVPWCTYTSPEIAHVGAYEHELQEKKIKYRAFKTELDDNDRAILEGGDAKTGFVKIIVEAKTDKILGCTIVAENAGDMISEVTTCMVNKIGANALSGVIHPYPTTADAIRICAGQVNKERLTPGTKKLLRFLMSLKATFT